MPSSKAKFIVYEDKKGFHWKLVVRKEVIAKSVKNYTARRFVHQAIKGLGNHASGASVEDE